ncbi:hypothetical protein BCR32DRAFT_278023 [Anaeromyces robustus]|uniref:Uncharacterized protein n=1 Tax=Anaeromyces robustus TaxID=1754192 RepID=A0A1Y1XCI5_9FUNG|nr:hypothetical protein BCR32DRAFT_278023 [Anaeromyces robustus]|eukprot:ORX83432.1 hypothetical protein BCR32DRAFT_278023 [Anaeromyces robustus]
MMNIMVLIVKVNMVDVIIILHPLIKKTSTKKTTINTIKSSYTTLTNGRCDHTIDNIVYPGILCRSKYDYCDEINEHCSENTLCVVQNIVIFNEK